MNDQLLETPVNSSRFSQLVIGAVLKPCSQTLPGICETKLFYYFL